MDEYVQPTEQVSDGVNRQAEEQTSQDKSAKEHNKENAQRRIAEKEAKAATRGMEVKLQALEAIENDPSLAKIWGITLDFKEGKIGEKEIRKMTEEALLGTETQQTTTAKAEVQPQPMQPVKQPQQSGVDPLVLEAYETEVDRFIEENGEFFDGLSATESKNYINALWKTDRADYLVFNADKATKAGLKSPKKALKGILSEAHKEYQVLNSKPKNKSEELERELERQKALNGIPGQPRFVKSNDSVNTTERPASKDDVANAMANKYDSIIRGVPQTGLP